MPADLSVHIEHTTYTLSLPSSTALVVLAILAALGVGTSVALSRWKLVVVGAGVIAAPIAGVWLMGFDELPVASMGRLFADAYRTLAIVASVGGCAIASALASFIAARPWRSWAALSAAITLGLGAASLWLAIDRWHWLGPRSRVVPVVVAADRWRGHAGFDHPVSASLARPEWRAANLFNQETLFDPVNVDDATASALGWSCDDCKQRIHPTVAGTFNVHVHGSVGRARFEQSLTLSRYERRGAMAAWHDDRGQHDRLADDSCVLDEHRVDAFGENVQLVPVPGGEPARVSAWVFNQTPFVTFTE